MKSLDTILQDYYFNKKYYVNANALLKLVKPICEKYEVLVNKQLIQQWLDDNSVDQQMQTVQPPIKKNYLPYFTEYHNSYMIDLTFLPRYKKYNKQYYVLFTAININTRVAYAYYSKDKTADTIIKMAQMWKRDCPIIDFIYCDEGSEFNNKKFMKWAYLSIGVQEIKMFNSGQDKNALCILNRFHLNLKKKLLKHFALTKSYNWVDSIDEIVSAINNTYNSGIHNEPNNTLESDQIFNAMQKAEPILDLPQPFALGDKVRVRINKKHFDKKSDIQNYTSSIYIITKINSSTIRLSDMDGEPIAKLFKTSDIIKAKGKNTDFDEITGEVQNDNQVTNRVNRELRNLS